MTIYQYVYNARHAFVQKFFFPNSSVIYCMQVHDKFYVHVSFCTNFNSAFVWTSINQWFLKWCSRSVAISHFSVYSLKHLNSNCLCKFISQRTDMCSINCDQSRTNCICSESCFLQTQYEQSISCKIYVIPLPSDRDIPGKSSPTKTQNIWRVSHFFLMWCVH